jgi:uncharacterized membrane protein YbhN (UPF0104 family)
MNALRTFGAALILLGGFAFLMGVKAVKNYNLYFITTGLITGVIGLILVTIINKKKEKIFNNEFEIWKNTLEKRELKHLWILKNARSKQIITGRK